MRILPDHPSLDFLRREAKDVLAAMRESAPATSLAEAQRSLADQYGFRDWTQLKAEVDARRADPPIAPAGLAEAIAEAFGLGALTAPVAPISFAPTGRRWCLTTDRGRFVAAPHYDWMSDAQAATAMQLQRAARDAGVRAPDPIPSAAGGWIATIGGEPWRVDAWVDLGPTPLPPIRVALAETLGRITATLHDLALPTDLAISPYLTWRRPAEDWEALVARARTADAPWTDGLVDLVRTVVPSLSSIELPAGIEDELILCSCNLIPENVATAEGDELVVVEWLFAGALTPALELASMLPHWFVGSSVNERGIAAFLEAYAKTSERKAAPVLTRSSFAVAATGWLNWTFNTFCEAIDPATRDKAAFTAREANDLLAHPLTVERIDQLAALTT
jgi:Ser/Thr protein kinase RdoA (MazF antagonist)